MSRTVKYTLKLWAAVTLPIGLASCMSHHDSVVIDINPVGWENSVELTYKNKDTVILREAALVLRYENGAENGGYIIELRSPSGVKMRDTLKVLFPVNLPPNEIHELNIPYRTNVRLSENGTYTFTITPATATHNVWSAGIDFKNND